MIVKSARQTHAVEDCGLAFKYGCKRFGKVIDVWIIFGSMSIKSQVIGHATYGKVVGIPTFPSRN
jgi:hypothetical protein